MVDRIYSEDHLRKAMLHYLRKGDTARALTLKELLNIICHCKQAELNAVQDAREAEAARLNALFGKA